MNPPTKKQNTMTERAIHAIAGVTEELPSLPFVHKYKNGKLYYMRECYDQYYKLVKEMLDDEEECVTVTGTPGIGKSVFYAYFFNRFREHASDTWIIAMSYKKSNITKVTIFESLNVSNELLAVSEFEREVDRAVQRARSEKKKVLFLCDGQPNRVWSAGQMVVFASPDKDWLGTMRKDACTIYMPLWTCEELQLAAMSLELKDQDTDSLIGADVIKARYNTFGGVARECLLTKEFLVNIRVDTLVQEVDKISNPGELANLLKGVETQDTCHRIIHYVPDASRHMMWATIKVASPFVKMKLVKKMLESVDNDRKQLLGALQGIPQGAALYGHLFETYMHEVLEKKCTLQLRLLRRSPNSDAQEKQEENNDTQEKIEIENSSPVDEFELNGLSSATAKLGPYHKPKSKQFESIDAFYLKKMETAQNIVAWNAENRLFLFQMTVSENHPVNAAGIISVLTKLGLLEAVERDPNRVALIFVVPLVKMDGYIQQVVVPEAGDVSDSVMKVRGIGEKTAKNLFARNITTVGELRAAIEAEKLPPKMVRAQALESLKRGTTCFDAIAKIPQYVWSLRIPTEDEDENGSF